MKLDPGNLTGSKRRLRKTDRYNIMLGSLHVYLDRDTPAAHIVGKVIMYTINEETVSSYVMVPSQG